MNLERIEKILEKHEGKRKYPYRCTAGKLTIGIGRNLDDMGLSDTEIYFLLGNDIKRAVADLKTVLGDEIYRDLSDVRQEALVNMIFNLGRPTFEKFQNMIRAIKQGNHYKASREMLKSNWAKQVGQRAQEISKAYRNNKWEV